MQQVLVASMDTWCFKLLSFFLFFFLFLFTVCRSDKIPHMGDARNRANVNFWTEHTITWNEDRIKRGTVPLFVCLVQFHTSPAVAAFHLSTGILKHSFLPLKAVHFRSKHSTVKQSQTPALCIPPLLYWCAVVKHV